MKPFRIWLFSAFAGLILFLIYLEGLERKAVRDELEYRSRLLAARISSSANNPETLSISDIENLAKDFGASRILICRSDGDAFYPTDGSAQCIGREPAHDRSEARYFAFRFDKVLGGAATSYVWIWLPEKSASAYHNRIGRSYVLFALILIFLFTGSVGFWMRRSYMTRPFRRLISALVEGDVSKAERAVLDPSLASMAGELDRVLQSMRPAFSQEAAASVLWNPERLRLEVQRLFGDRPVSVIANREPYIHNRKGKKIEVVFPASGLVTAVEPAVRACGGLWIGSGSGSADRETSDANGIVAVPPGKPEYLLKRVWLSKEEEEGYYYGFANEGLWPLCHIAHQRPIFRKSDWDFYSKVNQKFADAFVQTMNKDRAIALIQDYHFALLPEMIRRARPDAVTSLFWHIPWPNPEVIQICPWREELLRGMLGADLIGFHIQYHCNNFLDTVDRFLEARVDRENFSVTIQGHTCFVKPFPISVEWPSRFDVEPDRIPEIRASVFDELSLSPDVKLGIGVDRLDYTKGILERFFAIERFLEKHLEWIGKFVFVQIAAPSRSQIPSYQNLEAEVQKQVNRICFRFHRADGKGDPPIILKITHHSPEEVFRHYRAADLCLVSSLHDGMNLVAKEFLSSRSDCRGTLILSIFAGASRELHDAFIVNPYDTEAMADAIFQALTLPIEEQRVRMQRMRDSIAEHNVYAWAAGFLGEIHRIAELRENFRST